ncbi:LysR family transcriptional regulator [Aureimonas jatrophae]|uniref:DNA-binding transcriptional regulator, LysR family n=1 Tax=Aureimonas jatrophae TaxID=1166073 RepID=A0A1H0HU87_9HYPH|nr:LysR family transcriptional regulator [Aureimonas jatrophae]MBB3950762.1 DNA-binding transcriptional LysR family regulator [Aureimonas jatrophae]SDO22321.1 DNA-binding transcriptional regulator, LysR family [Aureimonas jatrophae]
MNSEPSWDLYRSFAAVIDEGSLSAAARRLGLTQPSVSRHVELLEQAVGGTLFVRSQRGLSPTDRALALAPHAREMLAIAAALRRTASADPGAVEGTVRITASEVMALERLPPVLADLRRRHPGLAIELVSSNALDDLLQRRADIALRMVEPVQKALLARRLGNVALGLHARRDYLEHRGTPRTLADLAGHDLIGPDTDAPGTRAMLDLLPGLRRENFALRTDSHVAHLAAIRAGFGIGVCQVALAAPHPDLVRVLPDAFAPALPLWLAMHEDLRGVSRCRAVFDALAAAFTSRS